MIIYLMDYLIAWLVGWLIVVVNNNNNQGKQPNKRITRSVYFSRFHLFVTKNSKIKLKFAKKKEVNDLDSFSNSKIREIFHKHFIWENSEWKKIPQEYSLLVEQTKKMFEKNCH